jgi:hypothetical protein
MAGRSKATLKASGTNTPTHIAASTSEGQCTPSTSRDKPTSTVHSRRRPLRRGPRPAATPRRKGASGRERRSCKGMAARNAGARVPLRLPQRRANAPHRGLDGVNQQGRCRRRRGQQQRLEAAARDQEHEDASGSRREEERDRATARHYREDAGERQRNVLTTNQSKVVSSGPDSPARTSSNTSAPTTAKVSKPRTATWRSVSLEAQPGGRAARTPAARQQRTRRRKRAGRNRPAAQSTCARRRVPCRRDHMLSIIT